MTSDQTSHGPSNALAAVRRLWAARWVRTVVGLIVVGVAFVFALPRFAPYGQVVEQLGDIDGRWLVALVIVGAVNLVAPTLSFRAALPGLRLGHGVAMDWATTALTNLVPGGSALAIGLTWTMLRSFELAGRAIARAIVVTGVWDGVVKLGAPLVAIGWLATERPISDGLVRAAVFGALLFLVAIGLVVVVLSGAGTAAAVGRAIDRLRVFGHGWPPRLDEMRRDTVEMLAGRWPSLTWWTIFGHANLYLLLVVSLRAVGVDGSAISPAEILAAFAFGRLVTAVPVTPGGLGVLEVGLVGALGTVGSAPEAAVVAAVLLFRFMNFAIPLPLGALSWLWWRRLNGRQPAQRGTGALPGQPQHDLQ